MSIRYNHPEQIDCCFLLNVSPVKTPENGGKPYFDIRIQMPEKQTKALCFETSRRNEFHTIQVNKSPIKIRKFRMTSNFNVQNILMDERTQVTPTEALPDFHPIDSNIAIPLSQFLTVAIEQLMTVKGNLRAKKV